MLLKGNYKNLTSIKKMSKRLFLSILICSSMFLALNQFRPYTVKGHSTSAMPKEIYSLYNGTIIPTINGAIEFNATSPNKEWASAAIYDMYDSTNTPRGKILIQNDDTYLYIGMDMIDHENVDPVPSWGALIYFDLNHNGILDSADRSFRFLRDVSEIEYVDFCKPNSAKDDWDVIQSKSRGELLVLSTGNATMDSDFTTSYFDKINTHRQYEFRVSLDALNKTPGDLFGIGFEATNKYDSASGSILWPQNDDLSIDYRVNPKYWGDISLGKDGEYIKYVVKENFNIKEGAVGFNNRTFLREGDIDGDGYDELIVFSNRAVTGDTNLIAIYDVESGSIVEKWTSWNSVHYSEFSRPIDISCYDFNGDGEEEIYLAMESDYNIYRLSEWNSLSGDFDYFDFRFYVYDMPINNIAIGDATNDNNPDIIVGYNDGYIVIGEYKKYNSLFEIWSGYKYTAYDFNGSDVVNIGDILIADMDRDSYNYDETLTLFQDLTGTTALVIYEFWGSSYFDDNPTDDPIYGWEDDLPIDSHENTFDDSGHTILVEDVDNDGEVETIIVGNDYLKIFGRYSFNDSSIPLVLDINDETFENMSGSGVGVLDINGDSMNELVVSCNNGTTIVYQIVDLNSDPDIENLFSIIQWSGNIGTSPGSRSSIIGLDVDGDLIDDAIIGDDFGQILALGLGPNPTITITKPSYDGFTSNEDTYLVQWNVSADSLQIHHYEIYVNGQISFRIGGSQIGVLISLDIDSNIITVICTDIRGKTDDASRLIYYDPGAPSVTITDPDNFHQTSSATVTVYWDEYDPGNDLTYYIYANSSLKGTTTNTFLTFSLGSEGTWNITVYGTNPGGDKAKDMIYVIYDNSAPVITITSPSDYSAVKSSTIIVSWTAYDLYTSIDYFKIYRDGLLLGNTTSNSYEVNLPTEKDYIIRVEAYDILDHSSYDIVHVTKDITPPTVDLTALSYPTNNDGWYYTESSDLFIEWSGDDVGCGLESFEVWVEDDLYGVYPIETINDTVTLSTEGPNDIIVIAYDEAGNSASDQYTVALDVSDPFVDIVSPYDFFTTGADNVTVNWDAYDNGAGIKQIDVIVNGTTEVVFTDPFPDSYLIDLPENKTYVITILVTDYLDNTAQDTIYIIHDPTQPAVYFTSPVEIESYSNTADLFVSWSVTNLMVEQFIIYVNTTTEYYYTSSTLSTTIDLETALGIVIDQYTFPIANITIVAIVGGIPQYFDTRFVKVDIGSPNLIINNPSNLSTIIIPSFTIQWSGSDFGSGIASYVVKINDTIIGEWSSTKTSQFVDASSFDDGTYKITVEAYDKAGNVKIKTHYINVYLTAPEFTINISDFILTNDPNFPMTISVYNTGLGVSEVIIIADGEKTAYTNDFNGTYQTSPFDLIVNIKESVFIALSNQHNLSITIYDFEGHSRNDFVEILVDKDNPYLISNPIFDNFVLGSTSHSIEISEDIQNIHNITLSSREENGILGVQLLIYNENITYSYFMVKNQDLSSGDLYIFEASINFDDYSAGIYNIQFIVSDYAGNSLSETFTLIVTLEQVEIPTENPTENPTETPVNPNWFMENLFTIIIPAGSGLLLIIILSIIVSAVVKKRSPNRGWEDVIDAVAYVTKTGLTTCYVPYSLDMFEDEQLFGGAMTGVVGILGEITGETNVEMKVHVMEFGGKRLIICPGLFGNSILLVRDAKPILKELLQKFTLEFELTYKHNLSSELVNLNDFDAVTILVETYFGVRKNLPTFEQVEIIQERFEDIIQTETEEYLENNENKDTTVVDYEIIENSENIMNENSDLAENIDNIENNDNTDFNDF